MLAPTVLVAILSIIVIVLISLLNVLLIEKRKLAVIPVPVRVERRTKRTPQ